MDQFLFERAGYLLGLLQFAAEPGEEVFVGYDRKDSVFRFTKAADKLYFYVVTPRELEVMDVQFFAVLITDGWKELK